MHDLCTTFEGILTSAPAHSDDLDDDDIINEDHIEEGIRQREADEDDDEDEASKEWQKLPIITFQTFDDLTGTTNNPTKPLPRRLPL